MKNQKLVVLFAKALDDVLGYKVNRRKVTVNYCARYSRYIGKKVFNCKFKDKDTAHGNITEEGNGLIVVYVSHIGLDFPNLGERVGQKDFHGYTIRHQLTSKAR